MRAVAAVLVVFCHAADLVEEHPQLGPSHLLQLGGVGNFGAIGVDLFFIISGFVMALSVARLSGADDALRFLRLRWLRVAPPYLIACGLLIVLFSLVGTAPHTPLRALFNAVVFVPVLDTEVYTIPVLDVGWTLAFEFTFYLAVAVMVLLGLAKRLELLALALVACIVAGMLAQPETFLLRWATNPILLEFVLGLVAYWMWDKGLLARARALQCVLGAAAAGVLAVEVVRGFGSVSEAWGTLDGTVSAQRVLLWGVPLFFVFIAILPLGAADRPSAVGRLGRSLGDASYSIYLMHLLTFVAIATTVNRYVPAGPLPAGLPFADLVLALSVVAATLTGVGFYTWVERPLTEALRRRDAARRAAAHGDRPATPAVATAAPAPQAGPRTERLVMTGLVVPPPRAAAPSDHEHVHPHGVLTRVPQPGDVPRHEHSDQVTPRQAPVDTVGAGRWMN